MTIDIEKISNIHNKMLDNNIFMAYKGGFNTETVNTLLLNAKRQLEVAIGLPERKKIYNIMVECLENIHKHADKAVFEREQDPHYPLFVIGKSGNSFYITAGNIVRKKDRDILKQKLDGIKQMNREKLKEEYRGAMLKGEFSEKGGIGLGIIDMALKSGNKLDYVFKTIKDDIAFFILEIKVSSLSK